MSHFDYTDSSGARLRFEPISERGDRLVMVSATSPEHSLVVVDIDPARVEEVVAGLRDMARQAGGQAEPKPVQVRVAPGPRDFMAMIRKAAGNGPTGSVE